MANEYDVGDLIRCSGAFTNISNVAVDPDNVHFKVRDPSLNTTSYQYGVDAEVVRDSVGNYHVDVDVDEAGYWWFRFYGLAGDGSNQGAEEQVFKVAPSKF